jgi:pyridoxine 4-dehydrogenase
MAKNVQLVEALEKIARKKGVTPAQLSIAWVSALGPHVVPIPGSSHKKRTLENLAAADIALTADEQKEIDNLLASMEIVGHRYPQQAQGHLWG